MQALRRTPRREHTPGRVPLARAALVLAALLASTGSAAAQGILVTRGAESDVFGSCMPTLDARNGSAQPVDFLQIDLVLRLKGGEERILELRSAYRGGIERPIAPGASATLAVQPDLSRPLGAPCRDVTARRPARAVCEASGRDCASLVQVQP